MSYNNTSSLSLILDKLKLDFPTDKIEVSSDQKNIFLNGIQLSKRWSSEIYVNVTPWWKFWKPKLDETLFFTRKLLEKFGFNQVVYLEFYSAIKDEIENRKKEIPYE